MELTAFNGACRASPCTRYRGQTRPILPRDASPQILETGCLVKKISRAGLLQCQASASKPAQLQDRHPGLPDISMLSPELQQQWDVERNMHLGAVRVKPSSGIKAVWQCDKCPAGQPHIWTANVQNRTRGTQCPYCSNRLVCLHNSLAAVAPDVAQYWNHSKNKKMPEQVLAGSTDRAEWKCPACNKEWEAPIRTRTRNGSGCPKCSRASRVQQSQPTFAEAQPAELAEWDYERNDAEDIYPNSITLGSNKLVHWVCSCCPRGQPHRWTAAPYSRIGSRCAVCTGHQACACNSLESLIPSVAAEFDVDKNGFTASQITAWSGTKVWWRNANRGSWRQRVSDRTDKRLSKNQQGSNAVLLLASCLVHECHKGAGLLLQPALGQLAAAAAHLSGGFCGPSEACKAVKQLLGDVRVGLQWNGPTAVTMQSGGMACAHGNLLKITISSASSMSFCNQT